MDFERLVAFHREKNADVTIAMHTCAVQEARTKGIAQVHPSSCECGLGRVLGFFFRCRVVGALRLGRRGNCGFGLIAQVHPSSCELGLGDRSPGFLVVKSRVTWFAAHQEGMAQVHPSSCL
jgi:hypothetical protein